MVENQTLYEFLEDQMPSYYNPAGVEILMNADSSIFVCSDYPGFKQPDHISLELFQEVKTAGKAAALLQLSKLEQLVELTPKDLLGLYEQGHFNIVCTLDRVIDREMSFRKNKKDIWARNTNDEIHQVKEPLERPEDFIAYTLRYYDMINN